MPMSNNGSIINFTKYSASFAAYTLTLLLTNDASAATALNLKNMRLLIFIGGLYGKAKR